MKRNTIDFMKANYLVTIGMRIAYMDDAGLIDIPGGVDGEDDLAEFSLGLYRAYNPGADKPFDIYIEEAIIKKYGRNKG